MTSKYFTEAEVACKCGCGTTIIQPDLVTKLDELRETLGRPVAVNSWTRCLKNNAAQEQSVEKSAHTTGYAVDISATTGAEKFHIMRVALALGFKRVGVGKTFVHLDIDPEKPQGVVWTYA